MGERSVELDGVTLDHHAVAAVAHKQRPVVLGVAARAVAANSARFADAIASSRPLYGRSTGVGANKSVVLLGDPAVQALLLLRSHATSAGTSRSGLRVRAMLTVRLNQLAAGGSGVAPRVLDGLLAMINDDALPEIKDLGSIGTADLSALATTALALMGESPTTNKLSQLTTFGRADGLAFISSNAAVLGDAALALSSLASSVSAALVVAALSFHAVDGNAEAYSIGAQLATPFPGAVAVCQRLRSLVGANEYGHRVDLRGQPIFPVRIQDPFGLRALPQVHGPVLDALEAAAAVLDRLINAPAENPLVLADSSRPDGGLVAHHAGFHLAYLQMALDTLALAIAQSSASVMARLAALNEPELTGLTPFLGDGTPGASGVMVVEYVAASALGAIRAAAIPAGLQTVTLSRGVEDDASFASLAATQCLEIAHRYQLLLACELLMAVRANRMRLDHPGAGRIGVAMELCAELPTDLTDRDLTGDLAIAFELIPALAADSGLLN